MRELEEMVRLASTLHTQLKRSVLLFVTESSFLSEVFSVIWDERTHTHRTINKWLLQLIPCMALSS